MSLSELLLDTVSFEVGREVTFPIPTLPSPLILKRVVLSDSTSNILVPAPIPSLVTLRPWPFELWSLSITTA